MDEPIDVQPATSFWHRRRVALIIGTVVMVVLCAAAIGLLLYQPGPSVTPVRQMIAQQALQNPDSAPLHLGRYGDVNNWYSPGANDYAVQDGMVIFPVPASGIPLFDFTITYGDRKTPVLVYAPNGDDLSTRPNPPADQSWFFGNEWYLYDCQPVSNTPLWWGCTLLVGGNI